MGSSPVASQAPPRENAALPLSGYSSGLDERAGTTTKVVASKAGKRRFIASSSQVDVRHVGEQDVDGRAEHVIAEERLVEPPRRVDAHEERVGAARFAPPRPE